MQDIYIRTPENLKHIVYKLEENSVDYKALSEQIKCTIGRKEKGCDIKDIFRIKNSYLEDAFHKKLTEEERRHSSFSMLFHGTSGVAIDSIIKNGFDMDATPSDINILYGRKRSKKAVHGKGVYLTNYSSTALDYGNNIYIICCKVFLGNCEKVHYLDANAGWDISYYFNSRRVIRESDEVFVVKDAGHVLPQYVITFETPSFISKEKRNLFKKLGRYATM